MTIRSASRNVIVDPSLATLAELIDRIAAADQLPKRTRRDWTWALNAIARAAGTDPRAVRAHPVYLRPVLKRAAPESIGIGRDAWKNVRSLSGKALTWAGLATPPTRFQASLTPSWTALRDKLSDRGLRMRLSRFFHFCSAQGIAPSEVNNHVLTLFYDSLLVERNLRDPREARRVTAKSWNNAAERIPGWPQQRLLVPSLRRIFSLQWGAFPTGLEADVEEYLRRAAGSDLLDEAFMHALRPATIHSRRAQLRYFATAVVKSGVDIDTLVNLPAILVPEMSVVRVFETTRWVT
jgi:hypothetical protein